jgi:heme exporter protein D
MPELGQYATEVLSAYAVSIVVLALLVGVSFVQSRRVKAALAKVEADG